MTYREQDRAKSHGKVIDIFVLGQILAALAITLIVQFEVMI